MLYRSSGVYITYVVKSHHRSKLLFSEFIFYLGCKRVIDSLSSQPEPDSHTSKSASIALYRRGIPSHVSDVFLYNVCTSAGTPRRPGTTPYPRLTSLVCSSAI